LRFGSKQRKLVHPCFSIYTRTLEAVIESSAEKPRKLKNLADLCGPSLLALENAISVT